MKVMNCDERRFWFAALDAAAPDPDFDPARDSRLRSYSIVKEPIVAFHAAVGHTSALQCLSRV
jgi:hypothetical protein